MRRKIMNKSLEAPIWQPPKLPKDPNTDLQEMMKKIQESKKKKSPIWPAPKLSEMEEPEILSPEDYKKLDALKKGSEFPLSRNLPENPNNEEGDESKYEKELKKYKNNLYSSKESKTDFVEKGNPNIGWKLHLNVAIENVKEVSRYLKENGFNHKYLSGGKTETGKIFTIYIGSYKLTKKLAEEISRDLIKYLCKPIDSKETEFAPGVSARFVVPVMINGQELKQQAGYGYKGGLEYLFEDYDKWHTEFMLKSPKLKNDPDFQRREKEFREKTVIRSYKKFKELYGEYFTG